MTKPLALDHKELDQLLGKLLSALEARNLEQSHAHLDFFWARLAVHIRAEHLQLFPAIVRALDEGTEDRVDDKPSATEVQSAIERLHSDHDVFMRELSDAMQSMRQLLTRTESHDASERLEEVRAKVVAVSELLAAHNDLEENQVYLWAEKLLNTSERATLEVKLQKELENMPPRFAAKRPLICLGPCSGIIRELSHLQEVKAV